jgi:hypothetical protein
MKALDETWTPIWRALARTLLRDGLYPMKSVERAARERNWRLRVVSDVAFSLAIETVDIDGELYWRLSGKVIPLLSREAQNPRSCMAVHPAEVAPHKPTVRHDLYSEQGDNYAI